MEKIISRIVINRFSFPCNFQKIRRTRSKFLSIILNLIFENFINKKKKRSPQFSAAKNKLDKVDKHGDRRKNVGRGRRENNAEIRNGISVTDISTLESSVAKSVYPARDRWPCMLARLCVINDGPY